MDDLAAFVRFPRSWMADLRRDLPASLLPNDAAALRPPPYAPLYVLDGQGTGALHDPFTTQTNRHNISLSAHETLAYHQAYQDHLPRLTRWWTHEAQMCMPCLAHQQTQMGLSLLHNPAANILTVGGLGFDLPFVIHRPSPSIAPIEVRLAMLVVLSTHVADTPSRLGPEEVWVADQSRKLWWTALRADTPPIGVTLPDDSPLDRARITTLLDTIATVITTIG